MQSNPQKTIDVGGMINGTIDIVKILMALLVVCIHTEPFRDYYWLDKGFGILTRLCIPFFFVASGYFFWIRGKRPWAYAKRMAILYILWQIVYVPFQFGSLRAMTPGQFFVKYFVNGNYLMWFIWASMLGLLIAYALLKVCKPKVVLILAVLSLFAGCLFTTWAPLTERVFHLENLAEKGFEVKNGLFYGFPYMALSMIIAESQKKPGKKRGKIYYLAGLAVSTLLLVVESFVFIMYFKTASSILWMSVFPMTYYFFMLVREIDIPLEKSKSLLLRKMSVWVYLSQGIFLRIYSGFEPIKLTLIMIPTLLVVSFALVKLSECKGFGWLQYFC